MLIVTLIPQKASGSAPSSFTADSLRALELTDKYYKQETVKGTAATMYSAAVDTTVASLSTFILAMLANPQAQKKAQDEIDSVIAAGHLPDFGDEEAMPYVAALIKEVLRWGSVVPFGALSSSLPALLTCPLFRCPSFLSRRG